VGVEVKLYFAKAAAQKKLLRGFQFLDLFVT